MLKSLATMAPFLALSNVDMREVGDVPGESPSTVDANKITF